MSYLKDQSIGMNKKLLPIKTIMKMNTQENKLILLFNELKNCLFLLMVDKTNTAQKIVTENIFYQELKLKIITLKLMEEIFFIKQLMTQLNNTMKSEKYQQDKAMIIQQVVHQILLVLKKKQYRLIAVDLSKEIQQIVFTVKTNVNAMVYYIFKNSNETTLQFSKGTTKVL